MNEHSIGVVGTGVAYEEDDIAILRVDIIAIQHGRIIGKATRMEFCSSGNVAVNSTTIGEMRG